LNDTRRGGRARVVSRAHFALDAASADSVKTFSISVTRRFDASSAGIKKFTGLDLRRDRRFTRPPLNLAETLFRLGSIPTSFRPENTQAKTSQARKEKS